MTVGRPRGTTAELAGVVRGQLGAGADHVCVQFLPVKEDPVPALKALAEALRLQH